MISQLKSRIQVKEEKLDKLWNKIQKCIPNNLETAIALLNTYARDGEGLIELRKCLALAEKDKEKTIVNLDKWEEIDSYEFEKLDKNQVNEEEPYCLKVQTGKNYGSCTAYFYRYFKLKTSLFGDEK